ncbi:type II and III secretion system protein family protein [Azospirillum sp.]|uniref:type II and III secretion system protein family protein n=1 Tax=Azospirillum sp. TaxID=34012 RepID=UPI003D7291F5
MHTLLPRRLAPLFLTVVLLVTPAAHAAEQSITMEARTGQSLTVAGSVATVFVADPDIADVQSGADGHALFLFAKAPGRTTVVALNANKQPVVSYAVTVTVPITPLRQRLAAELPDRQISVESAPGGLILGGQVATPVEAQRVMEIARIHSGKEQAVINRMTVASGAQINLRVRVAEVSRAISKQLGFNWESLVNVGNFAFGLATGRDIVSSAVNAAAPTFLRGENGVSSLLGRYHTSSADVNVMIDALAQDGLISLLAEPNLVAQSGETASFLAGGEFPIPVARRYDEITIEFKKYGVSLDFVPTVLSANRISIRVRPEVSELTDQGAVVINNLRIPALSVRRAETTIELGSGQSFAIAGLLQNSSRTNVEKVPGLGDVPIMGALFRSSRFQRNETELVIIVTPYIVRPVSQPTAMATPADAVQPASDLERIFLGRINTPGGTTPPIGPGGARLTGDVGFMVD